MINREQWTRHYQQPTTESEVKDWMRGARAYTDWSLEEIARLKQENQDLIVALRRSQRELDRACIIAVDAVNIGVTQRTGRKNREYS